jgi:17beta-estradiol 17-dehydrogenase/3alpha(17beta)-hydroxysteroid dehydrogenase (NAD+)
VGTAPRLSPALPLTARVGGMAAAHGLATLAVDLAGRIGLVTGGGSGIGRAVSVALARSGCSVAVLDRDARAAQDTAVFINTHLEAAGKGGPALALGVDVTDLASVRAAVAQAQRELPGRLNVAVNCAGVTADGFMHKMEEAQWDRVLDINLKGTFFVTQAVANAINAEAVSRPDARLVGGSIVNISSIIGKTGNLGQANYAASKGGVIAFSKTAAKELARSKIRVNVVLPGFINTPMARAVPEKVLNKMLDTIPLGRLGEPEEIANAVLFLCSDHSSFVTGAQLEVTGGQFM